jgi:Uma2 family endonuclease
MSQAAKDQRRNSPEVEAAFGAVPPDQVAEIVGGELHVQSRPRPRHSRATFRLAHRLGDFDLSDGDFGGWHILIEPELHLGSMPDKVVPDLAGWRRARMPELPDTPAITLAPDWICEVLSPGTIAFDRGEKRRTYAREGVQYLWFVDPEQQLLEVFRLEMGRWVLTETFEGNARVRAEPFEVIEIELGRLWER